MPNIYHHSMAGISLDAELVFPLCIVLEPGCLDLPIISFVQFEQPHRYEDDQKQRYSQRNDSGSHPNLFMFPGLVGELAFTCAYLGVLQGLLITQIGIGDFVFLLDWDRRVT